MYGDELVRRVRAIYLDTMEDETLKMIEGSHASNVAPEPPINIVDTKPAHAYDAGVGFEHMYDGCGVDENYC